MDFGKALNLVKRGGKIARDVSWERSNKLEYVSR